MPRSRYLSHLLVLAGASLLMLAVAGPMMSATGDIVRRGLTFDAQMATDPTRMSARFAELVAAGVLAAAPFLVVMLAAAFLAPLAIGGWVYAPAAAAPKFDRLDPLKGLARMVSLPALAEFGKVVLVATLMGVVGAWFLMSNLPAFASLAEEALPAALKHLGWLTIGAFAALTATLAAASALDVPFQIFQHRKKLKMTLQEARQEEKETQGDPHLKARIRGLQREMARKRMMAAVPKADVVITNPTHFAVALKYIEGRHAAPVVVAKGVDGVAQKIRELADENAVPQVELPPLARALYKHVEIGNAIPGELYTAVAQVLAYVFQLKRYAAGRGQRPVAPRESDIAVPEGMDPLAPLARA